MTGGSSRVARRGCQWLAKAARRRPKAISLTGDHPEKIDSRRMAGRFRETALDSRCWATELAFSACGLASRFEARTGRRLLYERARTPSCRMRLSRGYKRASSRIVHEERDRRPPVPYAVAALRQFRGRHVRSVLLRVRLARSFKFAVRQIHTLTNGRVLVTVCKPCLEIFRRVSRHIR